MQLAVVIKAKEVGFYDWFAMGEIIWRNGPYIGGHHAFIFKLNFKHIYYLL